MSDKEKKKRTPKQQVFINEYLKCFNKAEAARRAGYSEKTAREIGRKLLTNVDMKSEIDERLSEIQMSADEALKLLSDMGRGDIGDLIDDNGLLDLHTARAKGMTKLIKKIKQKTVTRIGKTDDSDDVEITEIEFEMYDAQAAIEKILRAGGKLKDERIEIVVTYENKRDTTNPA